MRPRQRERERESERGKERARLAVVYEAQAALRGEQDVAGVRVAVEDPVQQDLSYMYSTYIYTSCYIYIYIAIYIYI